MHEANIIGKSCLKTKMDAHSKKKKRLIYRKNGQQFSN